MIHLFTHDSISLGEDGPTHQPIEQLASLRAMPHLDVIRPADANEVAEAWRLAIERTHNPVALVLTRQNVPIFDRSKYASAEGVQQRRLRARRPRDGDPELILIATGSEVSVRARRPRDPGRRGDPHPRRQPPLLGALRPPGPGVPRRGAAAGGHRPGRDRAGLAAGLGALRWDHGTIVGMTTFGQSAPFKDVEAEFGFTPEQVAEVVREVAERAAVKTST